MSTEEKGAGELCREDLERIFDSHYPIRLNRRGLITAVATRGQPWSDAQVDNALHTMKKRAVISMDADGYQLRTAPDSYNAKLLAERNNGPAPEIKLAETLQAASWEGPSCVHGETGLCFLCNPAPSAVPAPRESLILCAAPECAALVIVKGNLCESCRYQPVRHDQGVRQALVLLEQRLGATVDDLELKLDVLADLGRLLDPRIAVVLDNIAGDLRR